MKVFEAARLLGTTPRTLRFYEEKGLVTPAKARENGYRLYSEADIERLRWIIALRELGMPLAAIGEVLQTVHQHDDFLRLADRARALLYEEWVAAGQKLQALDDTIAKWRRQAQPGIGAAEDAAEMMKHSRFQRSSWNDRWDYDRLALEHGEAAPLAALAKVLTPTGYEHALIKTLEWIDPIAGEYGAELGAGTGNLSVKLAEAGVRLTAIEQSAQMLSILRGRLPHVEAKLGNLLTLPLPDRVCSFIACSFAMHHLNSSQQLLALAEMDRILLPGGRMAITDISEDSEAAAGSFKSAAAGQPLAAAIEPFRLHELQNWLKSHRYSIVLEHLDAAAVMLFAVKPE
ncbi:putative AdoMet-dependent methyltransferase [Paenibacillus algorifonticola]|uniref:Putative AdoMet-dependent methyltransferase n=1 Tax=Paenibacillus algorifonticola TaxID=684063 RepID=A0A1I2C7X3_9BACL|nr:putative AdoMet-dependent methyltransferase [Paenibacillus algorifonticola]